MKKIRIENRIYDVVDINEFANHRELYPPKFTAIQYGDTVLPIKNKISDEGPGVYYKSGSPIVHIVKPMEEESNGYSASGIIDYDNAKDIGEIINNNKLIKDIQADIVTNSDNVFQLKIGDTDTPEMKALKNAINYKQVDKKQYEDRFDQFQNDMRLLKGSRITLSKLVSICGAFDISAELILRDKPGCPNPMSTEISVDLTDTEA